MPQFDLSSLIVQLIWLFISFLSFYFIFSWYYLPLWAFLIKTRKKCESTTTYHLKYDTIILPWKNNGINNNKNTQNQIYFTYLHIFNSNLLKIFKKN